LKTLGTSFFGAKIAIFPRFWVIMGCFSHSFDPLRTRSPQSDEHNRSEHGFPEKKIAMMQPLKDARAGI
jgi:hypothetical protein